MSRLAREGVPPVPLRLVLCTLVLLLLAACGGRGGDVADDPAPASDSPTESATAIPATEAPSSTAAVSPDLPACSAVWRPGATLPRGYKGCADQGAAVPPDALGCSSGQAIVRYAERFYAVRGGPIRRVRSLQESRDYREMVETCRG